MLLRWKFRCCLQKGVGGGGEGCNNVMWSALDDVESWKMFAWSEDVSTLKVSLLFTEGGVGGV